ncbi:MAG: ABC transporter permease subunit, partial [Erysipelotrichaceae bacterium]|nr:ABC transporter permease subunit [Erysipelotrichaceae bacterium]
MNKNHLISIAIIILTYIVASLFIGKSYILPGIGEIVLSLKEILLSGSFFSVVFTTLYRTLAGLSIIFAVALLLALLAYFNKTVRELLYPLYVLLKTIPNITYIIVALLWLGRTGSVILVASLVVFPIFYNSILNALLNIDESLIKATRLYQGSIIYKICRVYLPLIRKDILSSFANCCSLGFKVSIMA